MHSFKRWSGQLSLRLGLHGLMGNPPWPRNHVMLLLHFCQIYASYCRHITFICHLFQKHPCNYEKQPVVCCYYTTVGMGKQLCALPVLLSSISCKRWTTAWDLLEQIRNTYLYFTDRFFVQSETRTMSSIYIRGLPYLTSIVKLLRVVVTLWVFFYGIMILNNKDTRSTLVNGV